MGGADILVHNVGIYPLNRVDQITFEEWRRVMSINLDSIFLLTQAFLPHMRDQGWGRIVGISSAMFHAGSPGSLHYVASKGGIIGVVRALAAEVGGDGVTVNALGNDASGREEECLPDHTPLTLNVCAVYVAMDDDVP